MVGAGDAERLHGDGGGAGQGPNGQVGAGREGGGGAHDGPEGGLVPVGRGVRVGVEGGRGRSGRAARERPHDAALRPDAELEAGAGAGAVPLLPRPP